MDKEKDYQPKIQGFNHWFKKKHKTRARASHLKEASDGLEDEGDVYEDEDSFMSTQMDSCILTNELRIFVGTWNVAGKSPVGSSAIDLDEWLNLKEDADVYILGFQEIVPLKAKNVIGGKDLTEATNWNLLIGKTLNNRYGCPWLTPMLNPVKSEDYNYLRNPNVERRASFTGGTSMRGKTSVQEENPNRYSRYKLMASKKMVGVFISVWINCALLKRYYVSSVRVCSVACGIMGYLGNKGSVSVSMSIEGTSFCFIVAHLASGEKKGDERRRNHQVSEIFRRTTFARLPQEDCTPHPLTILGHDRIFWFGDLNYRLYSQNDLARQLIKKQDWATLQEFDQLRRELGDGGVFQGWREGNIEFAPTYKYSTFNCNRYSGTLPSRAGEKQRTPAWCDRILWYGKGVKQLSYFRSESKFSDHRPVSALFSTQIEVLKSADSREQGRGSEEVPSTLSSLIAKEMEESPSRKKRHRRHKKR